LTNRKMRLKSALPAPRQHRHSLWEGVRCQVRVQLSRLLRKFFKPRLFQFFLNFLLTARRGPIRFFDYYNFLYYRFSSQTSSAKTFYDVTNKTMFTQYVSRWRHFATNSLQATAVQKLL